MTRIKICGLVNKEDADILNENQVDFAGFVLFYPKSKRCIDIKQAKEIMDCLEPSVKKVAVVVSPNLEQIKQIETAGFDMVQIHGKLEQEVLSITTLPILRAVNISDGKELKSLEQDSKIIGYVCDGKIPGGGIAFDWNCFKQEVETLFYENGNRNQALFMLAGGLYPETVAGAVKALHPDIVDVSSGVEKDGISKIGKSKGKDREKVRQFCEAVRNI